VSTCRIAGRDQLGHIEIQKLAKADLDGLVGRLRRGEVDGRRKWTPCSCNYLLYLATAVLDDQLAQGNVVRNVAKLVDRVAGDPKKFRTLTDAEMFRILDHECADRHLWTLALYGLRRGEIAGLRWEHVDLTAQTVSIVDNRVVLGKQRVESDTPKSKASRRTLPMPDDVVQVLKAARQRQREERLRFGEGYGGGEYVCSDEMGNPLHPDAIYLPLAEASERHGDQLREAARCPAFLRHAHAPSRYADSRHRGLARACQCCLHDGYLCALARRSVESRSEQSRSSCDIR